MALSPQSEEVTIDMTAAPGRKDDVSDSTHAERRRTRGAGAAPTAVRLHASGRIVPNDSSAARTNALFANVQRMDVKNAVVRCSDGLQWLEKLGVSYADRVLLDAPCTGAGITFKDPTAKAVSFASQLLFLDAEVRLQNGKDESDIQEPAHLQKRLDLAALELVNGSSKAGGVVVYST